MRFLIDAHQIGKRQTGNETWTRNVSRELVHAASGDEFTFVASAGGAAEVQRLIGGRPAVVSGSQLRRVLVDLPSAARRARADSMLVQYTAPPSRCPAVAMIHDLSVFDARSRNWLRPGFRRRVQLSIEWSVRRAAVLLTPSEFTRRGILDRWRVDPARVLVAPNAVDPDLQRLLTQGRPAGSRSDARRIIAVGNVLPRKNLETAAMAVASLLSRGRKVEFRIIGQVPAEATDVKSRLVSLLGAAVSFTGYVTAEQLADEYLQADVLVFPSVYEGFGIPVLEGMSAGVPVIAADATSIPEIAGDAAILLDPAATEQWAAALEHLLDDAAARSRTIEIGRRWASQWTWSTTASAVLEALRGAAR